MIPLPFISRNENIARYENGEVFILDRRVYPFKVEFVRCSNVEDVARAIEEMVTQSYGPGLAASYGMVMAARNGKDRSESAQRATLEQAAGRLIQTRPTNNLIKVKVNQLLDKAIQAITRGLDVEQELLAEISMDLEITDQRAAALGLFGASLIHNGDAILTHCWPDSSLVYTVRSALNEGKRIKAYCSETRPYLQGARLTADALSEMGVDTTVITDNMPAALMSRGMIHSFFAGSDRVTMSGHVVNKVGTLQVAICAKTFRVPFYAFIYGPDRAALTPEDVEIEERNPEETLYCLGQRTATLRAKGYYPAFDVTPPQYVTALVTDRGIFSPYSAWDYYRE
jgi:methylthioribose-1-phosphate isomerase